MPTGAPGWVTLPQISSWWGSILAVFPCVSPGYGDLVGLCWAPLACTPPNWVRLLESFAARELAACGVTAGTRLSAGLFGMTTPGQPSPSGPGVSGWYSAGSQCPDLPSEGEWGGTVSASPAWQLQGKLQTAFGNTLNWVTHVSCEWVLRCSFVGLGVEGATLVAKAYQLKKHQNKRGAFLPSWAKGKSAPVNKYRALFLQKLDTWLSHPC